MSNTELNKEILDILDNVIYWETCPKDYKVRIKAIKKQLTLTDVSQQRELLKSFCEYIDLESIVHPDDIEIDIKNHLKIFNCG
jgi:hypothetical protein